ncbi:MAG TPA: DUF2628 domain-containing protein [Hyphomicrobiaceae bacterium]|nr:DUF2628 domain-containing protein [Hyphomicrobiaceae bacterium]
MITYTVHEPPFAPADRLDRAERLVFVADAFSWTAFLFAPLWALANRLWLVLLGYIGVVSFIVLAIRWAGLGEAAGIAIAAVHFLIGLEGSSLKRWTLRRRGWQFAGSVVGRNGAECERRFFDQWIPSQPMIRAESLAASSLNETGGALPLGSPDERRSRTGWAGWTRMGRGS